MAMLRSAAGMLGILALIAAAVVGALAATGVLSEAATSPEVGGSQADVSSEAVQARPVSSSIDKKLPTGKLSWTVNEARRVNVIRGFTLPPSPLRGNFVVVTFSVKNTSDGPVTLDSGSLVLIDDEDLTSPPAASVNAEYVEPEKAILFNERGLLDPGEEREGRVNFDLTVPFDVDPASDLSGFRIRLDDGDPTKKEEEFVDLGF